MSRRDLVDQLVVSDHLPRSDPRSAGAAAARRRSRLHLRPGHCRQIRRRVQGDERSGRSNFPAACSNTPISEDAMVGTAIGAAIEGMRPIVEMQFADFSSIALNQILNNAGTHVLAHECPVPDHGSAAVRRHQRQRTVSQPEHGSALRALSGTGRRDAGDGRRRLLDADRGGRDR